MVFKKPSEELLKRLRQHLHEQPDQSKTKQAVSLLLARMAFADGVVCRSEEGVMATCLMNMFSIKLNEARPLVQSAVQSIKRSQDITEELRYLKEHLSLEDREAIVGFIEKMVYADGVEDDVEVFLQNYFRDVLLD